MASRHIWADGETVHASDLNTWYEDIETLQTDAETAADRAESAALHTPIIQNGTWWVWDFNNEEYVDTEINATGDDGCSPTLSETKVGKVTTVTVTDADGTHSFQIHDGADGTGTGDMLASTYDPNGMAQDIFAYADSKAPTQTEKDYWGNKSDKAISFQVILDAGTWDGGSNTITVADERIIADDYMYDYIVSPEPDSFVDYGKAQVYADNVTNDGEMTFHCGTVPTEDLEVNIVRMVVKNE